ncbi:hypothetical protein GH714_035113 [Hevea brasiliensis]|uniref:Uncharacterized protein n=1 Tax=Hevea brasiliensis TaxID=3981 RepID=A0A6A6MFW1_HEVBR|nr:hypothetical protein GH714_035113 [Hevea brasiliensis]
MFHLRDSARGTDFIEAKRTTKDMSLSEFQVELLLLASQLNGDYVLNTYLDIGKSMTVGEANRYAEDAVRRFLEAGKTALRAGANKSAIVTMRPSSGAEFL